MYRIEQTDFGIQLTFAGYLDKTEMQRWYTAAMPVVNAQRAGFSMFVDMRHMRSLPPESQALYDQMRAIARRRGLKRSVLILKDAISVMNLRAAARRAEGYQDERYVNANAEPNWEKISWNWLVHGVDPDDVDMRTILDTQRFGKTLGLTGSL